MICMACGKEESKYHITVSVNIFGNKTTRAKLVQFTIGENCELALQQVLCKDVQQKFRIARRLVVEPEFLSCSTEAWRPRGRRETFTDWAERNGASDRRPGEDL